MYRACVKKKTEKKEILNWDYENGRKASIEFVPPGALQQSFQLIFLRKNLRQSSVSRPYFCLHLFPEALAVIMLFNRCCQPFGCLQLRSNWHFQNSLRIVSFATRSASLPPDWICSLFQPLTVQLEAQSSDNRVARIRCK